MILDSAFSLFATLVRLTASVLLFFLMAHVWTPDMFGAFMYPYTLAAIVARIIDYGFNVQTTRDVARNPGDAQAIVWAALSAKMLLTVPAYLLMAMLAHSATSSDARTLLWLLMMDATVASFGSFLGAPMRASGAFRRDAVVAAVSNTAVFGMTATVLLIGASPIAAAAAMLSGRLLGLVAAWRGCRPFLGGERSLATLAVRPAVAAIVSGLPFGIHAIAGTVTMHVDTVMVHQYLGAGAVGVYQSGMRLLIGMLVVADALNAVYLTSLTRAARSSDEAVQLATRFTRHLLAIGIAGFATLAAAAPWLSVWLFGAEYAGLDRLLPLFGVLVVIRYWGVSYGTVLTLANRQGWRTMALCGVLLVGVGLTITLIPRFGLSGALYASIGSHAILYIAYAVMAWRSYRSVFLDRRAIMLGTVAVALGAVLVQVAPTESLLLRFACASMLIVAAVWFGFSPADRSALRDFLSRRRGAAHSHPA